MTGRRHAALAAAFALALTACSAAPGSPTVPSRCEAVFSHARCSNMVAYAAMRLGTSSDAIVTMSIVPSPTPEIRDGLPIILHVTSGGPNVMTLVALRDGTVHEVSMDCGGIPPIQCQDDPRLRASSVTMGGYFDTPEGATPVPSADPQAVAAARALRIARLDIPIDHDGRYEVVVGEATLPNGLLTVAEFGFASPDWPADVVIAEGVVALEVRSLVDSGRPILNRYDHRRVAGTERVQGVLVFDVLHHLPGAVLSVRDIIVR